MKTRLLSSLFVLASPVLVFAQAPKPAPAPDAKPATAKLVPLAQCRSDLKNARDDADRFASLAAEAHNESGENMAAIRADLDAIVSSWEHPGDPATDKARMDALGDLQKRAPDIFKSLINLFSAQLKSESKGETAVAADLDLVFSTLNIDAHVSDKDFRDAWGHLFGYAPDIAKSVRKLIDDHIKFTDEVLEDYGKLSQENAKLRSSLNFALELLKQDGAALAAANARASQQANFTNFLLLQSMIPKPQPPIRIDMRVSDCTRLPALCLRPN